MKIFKDITYFEYSGQPLQLDLYLPDESTSESTSPLPVVLHIPGGGWRNCRKESVDPWLCESGFAVASINYRLSSEAIAPANLHDCRAAVRWLRINAQQYGLDASRIGAWGGSAGGHLAALLGSWPDSDGEVSTRVRAVCDFCGPTDLTRIAIPEIRAQFPTLYEVTEQYLGGPVEERCELARQVSPLSYVSGDLPPTFIVHCRRDGVVPVEESEIYYEALQKAGVDTSLKVLDLDTHGVPMDDVKADVLAFFQRTLQHDHCWQKQ